jgi:hypothetical protein
MVSRIRRFSPKWSGVLGVGSSGSCIVIDRGPGRRDISFPGTGTNGPGNTAVASYHKITGYLENTGTGMRQGLRPPTLNLD